jgi:hypothetical protein
LGWDVDKKEYKKKWDKKNWKDRSAWGKKYYQKNKIRIKARTNTPEAKKLKKKWWKKYYLSHRKKLNDYSFIKSKRNYASWKGYIPLETKCEVCGKNIFFNRGDTTKAINFDHRNENAPHIESPSRWLMGHKCYDKNIELWESFNFGKLCHRCNHSLPTKDREDWVKSVVKYVFGRELCL